MKRTLVKSIFLIIPILLNVLYYLDSHPSTGIGGGSYDLSGFVYGWLTIIYLIIWLAYMLFTIEKRRADQAKKWHKILLTVGVITFIFFIYYYWNDLS